MFDNLDFPYAHFEEPGLRDTCTSLVVIVPERIYETAKGFRENRITRFDLNNSFLDEDELGLIEFINTCALAR